MRRENNSQRRPAEPSRRSFLTKVWMGLGALAVLEFAAVVIEFLRPHGTPVPEGDYGSMIIAGAVNDFATGSVTAFPMGQFYLSRLHDGGFLALSRKCTHLGCTVAWMSNEKKFICPCHSSAFDIRGQVISSPAPRPLDIYPAKIENKIITVDTRKPIRRSEFKTSQVIYPIDVR